MPIGYLITVAVVALGMLLALRPVHRPAPLRTASWALGSIVNESPFVAFYWVLAATLLALAQGDLATPVGWVGLGIACVTLLGRRSSSGEASRRGRSSRRPSTTASARSGEAGSIRRSRPGSAGAFRGCASSSLPSRCCTVA